MKPHRFKRTCVGCRARQAPEALVRVVVEAEGRLAADVRRAAPGRGAWLCREAASGRPAGACLARALKKGAFGRALRYNGKIDSSGLQGGADHPGEN